MIGAGPGGCACAALLACRGHRVTLLEQNRFIGGKCSTFEENGFMVDSGVHMFATGPKGPHSQAARELGVPQPWLVRDPGETIRMNERGFSYLHQNLTSLAGQKELIWARITGRHRIKIMNSLHRAAKRFGLWGLFKELHGVVKAHPSFLQKYDNMILRDFLYLFTDNRDFHRAINCISMLLMVVPYDQASAGEFIYCAAGIFHNSNLGVPRGGAHAVPLSFLQAFHRDGGNLILGVSVKEIAIEEGKVAGVLGSDDKFYPAKALVSNAGLKETVRLAGEDNFPADYVTGVKSLKLSYSWIASKLALRKRVVDLKAPSLFSIPQMEAEEMFTYCDQPEGVVSDPFLFVPIPTEWDATLAPPGRQLVIMGVPTSNEVDQEERSQRLLDAGEKKLFDIFPKIEKNLLWKSRTTNKDTNRITRKGTGECIGLAQIPGQVGSSKPSPKLPVEGLFVVGCDAGARGVGTEQATASAMLVSNLVE